MTGFPLQNSPAMGCTSEGKVPNGDGKKREMKKILSFIVHREVNSGKHCIIEGCAVLGAIV